MFRSTYAFFTVLMLSLALSACASAPTPASPTPTPSTASIEEFVFGVVLVGPSNDRGWSEAHYNGGLYVQRNIPNSRMLTFESLNPNDHPESTLQSVVEDMISQGARLIFITSDDFAADTQLVASQYPQVDFVHISGDHVLRGDAPPNLSNYMGKMIYGKMIAGCAAALASNNNAIGYVGPLINHETRRLVNAAYLGAKYCFENYRGGDPATLQFKVDWIGFWFYIPGVTADPTEVSNAFFEQGFDVVLSGIDTTEPLAVAAERANQGEDVHTIPYDYAGACDPAPDICLGVPYFNWGPGYLAFAQAAQAGRVTQDWIWADPDWTDLNNPDTSPIGFVYGESLTPEQSTQLDEFITGLSDGSIQLFRGPLNYQDGSPFLTEGETASEEQIWYMEQLLDGVEGLSD